MTFQETNEFIRDHLIKQHARSMGAGGYCVYRGPNGLMCAVGCLIPDDKYLMRMDETVDGLTTDEVIQAAGIQDFKLGYSSLLVRWQSYHDSSHGDGYQWWLSGDPEAVSPTQFAEQMAALWGGE